MDEQIKEYLNINAPKYAKFKGINPDFINNTESKEYKDFYDSAISFLEKGGYIQKMADGDIILEDDNPDWEAPEWFGNYRLLKYLTGWTKDLDASQAGGNLPQNKYHHRYGSLLGAFATNNAYTANKDLVGLDLNTYYNSNKSTYTDLASFVNAYNKNAETIRGTWKRDGHTYNGKGYENHNRLFRQMFANRSGSTTNDWDLGYSEPSEQILGSTTWMRNMDLYEKEFDTLTDDEKKNRIHKIGDLGYVYKKANGDIEVLTDEDKNKLGLETPSQQPTKSLLSGMPQSTSQTVNPLNKVDPTNLLELAKFIDAYRTNKKMKDLFQKEYSWAPEEYTAKHRNIYGDYGALTQGYKQASNTRSTANRLGRNTSDLRTSIATGLQGNKTAAEQEAQANLTYNLGVRDTGEKATEREFTNIDEQQKVANENRGREVAAHNVRLNNLLEYENLQYTNRRAYLDSIILSAKTKQQDKRNFQTTMLDKLYEDALANDPEVTEARKQFEKDHKDESWRKLIEAQQRARKRYAPLYYREMARLRGFNWNYNENVFKAKSGGKVSDDGPRRTRSKTLERFRRSLKDQMDDNNKKLDRLGRLTYLYAKRALGKKK